VPNSAYIGSAGSAVAGIRDEYDNDLDGTFESIFLTPGATRVSQNRQIDPDRRWPWVDEMLVGYRRQLPRQLTFDVSVIRAEASIVRRRSSQRYLRRQRLPRLSGRHAERHPVDHRQPLELVRVSRSRST
jgi:hypothetical protein